MLSIASSAFGKQNIGNPQKRESGLHKTAAGCDQTTAVIDLDVNNVRARLMTGGDMWPTNALLYYSGCRGFTYDPDAPRG